MTVETPADFGAPPAATAKRWISEIQLSEKAQEKWITRCKAINKRYKEERGDADTPTPKRKFAVLWANVQVKRPAVYARCPVPVVSRKFKDKDPVGRLASETLERSLISGIENYDFDWCMKQCRDEYLLFGRAQQWLRYVPHFKTVPMPGAANDDADGDNDAATDGQTTTNASAYEDLDYEEVICDYVPWSDFGTNVARNWADVYMVWRRSYMTRDEMHTRFDKTIPGGAASIKKIPLDWQPDNASNDAEQKEQFGKAQIYEVWDKTSHKVRWISKGYGATPLDEKDDMLGLKDFFPCPRPMLGTVGRDTMIPTPEFLYYQDQADEVDELTVRIGILTEALRMVGLYAASEKDKFPQVFAPRAENRLIPVDSWAAFQEKGGVKGLIEWVPIDMVVVCLQSCFETRKQLLDDIFQITGVSDIMRGDTDPNETKGAQQLKSQWGSSRVREDQQEIARFARDVLRMMAEVIGNKFTVETLKSMTDLKLMTAEEKQQAQALQQQAVLAAQQQAPAGQPLAPGAPPAPAAAAPPQPPALSPDVQRMMDEPSWDDVMALLRDKAVRSFRIDVETDSTVEPDQAMQQAAVVAYAQAVGNLLTGAWPIVQAAPAMMQWVGATVKMAGRRFNAGRDVEEDLDKAIDAVMQMPPQQPEQQKAGPDPQIEMIKAQAAAQSAKNDADRVQIESQKVQNDDLAHKIDAFLKKMELDSEDKRTQADTLAAWLDAQAGRAHEHTQGALDREHEAEQNDLDRENNIAAIKARPKPVMAGA